MILKLTRLAVHVRVDDDSGIIADQVKSVDWRGVARGSRAGRCSRAGADDHDLFALILPAEST